MRTMSIIFLSLSATIFTSCACNTGTAPVSMHWKSDGQDPVTGVHRQTYTLKNISGKTLAEGWTLYFNQLPYQFPEQKPAPIAIEVISSTYYKLYPTADYRPLTPGGEIGLTMESAYRLFKNCQAPEGAYIVLADGKILPVEITADPIPLPNDGEHVYHTNSLIASAAATAADIIPAPKEVVQGAGTSTISQSVMIVHPEEFTSEASLLADNLKKEFGADLSHDAATVITLVRADDPWFGAEGYSLRIADNVVTITAATAAGAFYGTQSLRSMLKGGQLPLTVPNLSIKDRPDLGYRGQMIDVVRTYATKEDMLTLIDVFASYKLNVLHFHFSDDEGWRIEIPGLPELTEVGARRGHTLDEHDMLWPAYEGGADPAPNQYLTRQDFIDLLKYAAERHIRVVPEIESPGHGRAAMRSMEARYRKYIATDKAKAEEYLLTDFDDTSVYSGAQYYTDNVMCVGLPSVYRFMEKVVDELMSMYHDAGLTLTSIHIGGDEVPAGVWTGSPVCKEFMQTEGIASFEALAEYYILRVNDILSPRGIRMAGWQELVVGRSEEFRHKIKDNISAVHCWHTIGKDAEVPNQLANLGYNVLLCNVTNLYLDMAYTPHPEEPGHWWGAFVDQRKSFAAQPYDIYASVRFDNDNNPVDISGASKGLTKLTEAGKSCIIGLQGQLFGETIRGIAARQRLLFPKTQGLAERGWNASPAWGGDDAKPELFNNAYDRFNAVVAAKELPWLASRGINFHIPQPGIVVRDGMLYANKTIAGAEIRYTTDGSAPDKSSALWTEPVECNAPEVKARLFYLGKESATTSWR